MAASSTVVSGVCVRRGRGLGGGRSGAGRSRDSIPAPSAPPPPAPALLPSFSLARSDAGARVRAAFDALAGPAVADAAATLVASSRKAALPAPLPPAKRGRPATPGARAGAEPAAAPSPSSGGDAAADEAEAGGRAGGRAASMPASGDRGGPPAEAASRPASADARARAEPSPSRQPHLPSASADDDGFWDRPAARQTPAERAAARGPAGSGGDPAAEAPGRLPPGATFSVATGVRPRCPACARAKKGRCGTESATWNCANRARAGLSTEPPPRAVKFLERRARSGDGGGRAAGGGATRRPQPRAAPPPPPPRPPRRLAPAPAPLPDVDDADPWSEEQVVALQSAFLVTVDPGAPGYWARLAACVPGKTADDCWRKLYGPGARAAAAEGGLSGSESESGSDESGESGGARSGDGDRAAPPAGLASEMLAALQGGE